MVIPTLCKEVRLVVARAPFESTLVPLLDELRTYCYEHQIEEIPALLAV
jgi:hypothetical protein